MSYLAKRFLVFLGVLGVLVLSVFISFRCGYSQGLEDAPRHFYSLDVARALRDSPDFRNYVNGVYRSVVDSVIRKGDFYSFVGKWLDEHPGCALSEMSKVQGVTKRDYDRVFYMRMK